MYLTSHITHSNVYTPYIAYHRSDGFHQLFRKLKPKPKLNPHNAHRSHIKICVSNVPNMPNVPNAFQILKPIQKSSKRVWVFRNTGANAFAKNQMRLAYEDKRDLYCTNPNLSRHCDQKHTYMLLGLMEKDNKAKCIQLLINYIPYANLRSLYYAMKPAVAMW